MAAKKNDEKLFDLRTLDAFQSRGVLKPADYEKYLKSLPDEEGNYDTVLIEEDEDLEDDEAEASEE
ncbi:hypothetical protein FBR05_11140 [Deltaproteobacteria bacterium PRO3]|nr:hypothetical protein [Deltaproteobacteria bacterium PRO3]